MNEVADVKADVADEKRDDDEHGCFLSMHGMQNVGIP